MNYLRWMYRIVMMLGSVFFLMACIGNVVSREWGWAALDLFLSIGAGYEALKPTRAGA